MKHLGHIQRHRRAVQPVIAQSTVALAVIMMGFAGCVDLTRPWNNTGVDMGPASTGGNAPAEAGFAGAGGNSNVGLGGAVALGGVTSVGVGGGAQLGGTGAGGSLGSGGLLDASLDLPNTDTGGATATLGGYTGAGGRASGGSRNGGASSAGGRANGGAIVTAGGGAIVTAGGSVAGGASASTGGSATGGTSAIVDASPPARDGGTLAGLVLRYTCDQTSGPKLADSSGHANDGTLLDTPPTGTTTPGYSFGAGKVGSGALILTSASSGYVAMPTGILTGATEMTVATWVYVTTVQSFQRIFDIGINANSKTNPPADGSNTIYMNLIPSGASSDRKLAFAITKTGFAGEQRVVITTTFPTAAWTHVAIVLGGGIGTLYINGVEVAASAITLQPVDLGAVDYAWIGKSQFADPYLNGQIDDFRVYNRALSSNDVQALYVSP